MTAVKTAPVEQVTDSAKLIHLMCLACSPDDGLCGESLADRADTEDDAECVVCIDMAEFQFPNCAKCGHDWRMPLDGVTA